MTAIDEVLRDEMRWEHSDAPDKARQEEQAAQAERYERSLTGFPQCPDCGEEVQPGDGDPDGLCWFCLNGVER